MKLMNRRLRLTMVAFAALTLFSGVTVTPAFAQSPSPNVEFLDHSPSDTSDTTNGLVVEGLGMMSCDYSLSSVEQATVADLNKHVATITEITPQNSCIPDGGQHIGEYESTISSLVSYVESHASNADTLWGGIMLDEEPDYGLDLTHLYTLNQWVNNKMGDATSGVTWWYTEQGNYSGYWSQNQYDAITEENASYYYTAIPAPQVYNSFQAGESNASGWDYQMVSWWAGASYPWDGESGTVSYASQQIGGTPYNQQFGTSHTFYWQNQFQGA